MLYNSSTRMPVVAIQRSSTSIPRPAKGQVFEDRSLHQPPLEVCTRTTNKTAYRLPRLRPNDPVRVTAHTENKVWSRHGYDYYSNTGRQAKLSVVPKQPYATPRLITLETQHAHLIGTSGPKFHSAMITPIRPPQARYYAGNVTDAALCKHMLVRNKAVERMMAYPDNGLDLEERGPFPTPVPGRQMSPPKSARSIHWTLSPMKNLHYDKRGKSRVQGPYSREFAVTCTAPNNWLRMKLGRTKTTLV